MFRPRRPFSGGGAFRIIRPFVRLPDPPDDTVYRRRLAPMMVDFARRYSASRGLYRIFNAAIYKFYRSNVQPPLPGDIPFATSATLPSTPTNTYSNGTWYLSATYFNGVLDSGFLPLGPHGETYLRMTINGGAAAATAPSAPTNVALEVRAGGVIRVNAFYARLPDGINAATEWSIGYTTDGSDPTADSPNASKTMSGGPIQVLAFDLPAQADGTTVKVLLQTRRVGTIYSLPGTVLTAIADAAGPSAPLSLGSWVGGLPEVL